MYETRGTARFFYSYDSNGILYSVKYTMSDSSTLLTYYFTHNSRGDIVGIYNGAGELRAHYEYDAWGNVLSVTYQNGNLNPFRYRGYYYDNETGLYYLMSRYYDPVTHRFINADGYFQSGGDILDANMSAYCRNNPISNSDPCGNITLIDIQKDIVNNPNSKWSIKDVTRALRSGLKPNDDINNLGKTTPYSFISKEYRIGEVSQISNGYPIGFYSKSGGYYVNNYKSSSISVYASNDYEVGLDILSASVFAGMDNLGVQLGLPYNESIYSLEISFSLEDFCLRVGWDKNTHEGDGVFVEHGGGIEINGWTIAAAALTIFGALYSVPTSTY